MIIKLLCILSAFIAPSRTLHTPATLVDHPIAAPSIHYLDGEWTVSSTIQPARDPDCTFLDDTDYNHGKTGLHAKVSSRQGCCQYCAQNAECAAAVFAGDGTCWLKTSQDMSSKSHVKGVSACVVKPSSKHGTQISIPGQVPGDLITDLQKAGVVDDPLFELNFLNASIWDANTWTYSKQFVAPAGAAGSTLLVFDGIKMGASIFLDGQFVANATDQFLRYSFGINLVQGAKHTLEVVFNPSIDCGGRWMSCTGGWDWAPYTNTAQDSIPTFTKGIWKSVYLAGLNEGGAAITDLVPQITYAGEYPTTPLTDETHGGFNVQLRVHTWSKTSISANLTITSDWQAGLTQSISIPAGNSSVTVSLPVASNVKLWWPVGHGAQPLYDVTASLTTHGDQNSVSTTRRVGFRVFALVTGNDTDPEYVKASTGADGTSKLGMLWRINGAAIFSKGANMIPMEELEGRMAANAHRQLVQSAVDGGMNTLRVWGGGMFLPRVWYEACDELGIMVYHDMQYAQSGHSPQNNPIQDAELRHQIRRLASHASIVMWDGCNECRVIMGSATGVYATFVMTVVAQEDHSRAVWPSCPALGWTSGVDRLTAIPNGKPLTTPPGGAAIETHGPYQHGTGFPAVNGASSFQPVSGSMNGGNPISLTISPNTSEAGLYIGLGQPNIFASEFGSSVFSSFESMAPTIAPTHWSIHGGSPPDKCGGGFASHCEGNNVMAQRNYPCDNIIVEYFGWSDFDAVGEHTFKKQLWQCMVGQALLIKSDIETRRSQNQFGIIVWQYNEIWPTGGWGSIEYGTVGFTKGQVLGGRWKPLHYWYKASIFADVMATCGNGQSGVTCYVKNDSPHSFQGRLEIQTVEFRTGKTSDFSTHTLDMPAGAGTIQWFEFPNSTIRGTDEMLVITVTGSDGSLMSQNPVAFAHPKNMSLPQANVSFSVGTQQAAGEPVPIIITSDNFALYVTLTTLAQGRFDDNAFVMLPGTKTVHFYTFEGFDMDELKNSLRVEHTATYM